MQEGQGQQPFGNSMPYPMMIPFPMQSGGYKAYHGNEVPARVQIAMEFIAHLTFKTMTRGMVSGVGMQEIEGQDLLPVEEQTRASALNMLQAYFSGKLKPSSWEEEMDKPEDEYRTIACPVCDTRAGNKGCQYCKGKGICSVPIVRQ